VSENQAINPITPRCGIRRSQQPNSRRRRSSRQNPRPCGPQVDEVTPMDKTPAPAAQTAVRGRQPPPVVEASISVIGSSDMVAQAIGQPVEEVLQLQSDVARWALGRLGGPLVPAGNRGKRIWFRRERLAFIASQGLLVSDRSSREAREHAELLPPGGGDSSAGRASRARKEGGARLPENAGSDAGGTRRTIRPQHQKR